MKLVLFLFLIQGSCFIVKACITGEVRLANGVASYQGRVEICINGTWGTVCRDFWDLDNTRVVCRQLGYITLGATYFTDGSGTGAIFLDNVRCSGNECNLLDCPQNSIGTHNCYHFEDVGVSCSSSLDTCTPFNSIPSPTAPTIIMSSTNSFCEPPSSSSCNCPSFPSPFQSSYQTSESTPTATITTIPLASSVFTITTTFTLSVTSTTTQAGTIANTVNNCTASVTCQGAVAAAVVVPILILVLVTSIHIILFVIYRYRQKSGISKVLNAFPVFNEPVRGNKRASTLKEVDNRVIYNISDNEAYNAIDTSRQDLSGSASVPLSSIPENQQAPIYTKVRDTPEMEAERGEEVLYEHPSVMTD